MNPERTSNEDGLSKEAERAKKIYRYVNDTARRIDEATPACKAVSDLFTTYMEGMRQKIRDNCEKLMFTDPLAYGRKALELLWRKGYYETVSFAKKIKSKDVNDNNYILSHIECGIGQYHHIISKIITEFQVQIPSLDYPPIMYDDEELYVKKIDDDIKQWSSSTIHSCLIYLGDLSRYQREMFEGYNRSVAARYYLQAAHMDLSSGMPYNQLGNLYTDKNHNLDSACCYIHCLSCAIPFDGAEGNLVRLFEKNHQYLETVDSDQLEMLQPSERVKVTIARILTLAHEWFLGKDGIDVVKQCNSAVLDLKTCFAYDKPNVPDASKNYTEYIEMKEVESVYPSYLNPDIVYNIVKICLFCIHKLNETDPSKAFAAKAFTLALFSQLLQKFLKQMQNCGFEIPSRHGMSHLKLKNDEVDEELVQDVKNYTGMEDIKNDQKKQPKLNGFSSENEEEKTNGAVKINGKKLSKRRRRKCVNSSESSDESDSESDSENFSSVSDDLSSQSESYHSEDDSDVSEVEDMQEKEKSNNENKDTREKVHSLNTEKKLPIRVNDVSEKLKGLNECKIQNFLCGDNYLPSLKILQDWILTEKDLISSCGETGESLFQSVVDLLNILQTNFIGTLNRKNKLPSCKILHYAKALSAKLKTDYQSLPLPEDVNLRGTDICKFDKDAAEWQMLKKHTPTVYEENIMRILTIVNFGHQVTRVVPRIRYNRAQRVFFLKKNLEPNNVVRKEIKKKLQRSPPKGPKQRHGDTLMRSLGRLYLQSRVQELETAVRGGGRDSAPAYLVVDSDALTRHTARVKQLVKAGKFVVLVPTVVVQSIDELKKEVGGARDAIRWLETQLQSGSRFLRAQRPGETKPLPLLKCPRKAPKHVHNFLQIIEFCHHFVATDPQCDKPEKKKQSLLVLLTGSKLSDSCEEVKDFSYIGVARSAGVEVDNIVHFTTKWRHLLCKSGSKR